MTTSAYTAVVMDLEGSVGDILAAGITKMGLKKVGADSETATPEQMIKAIDDHIGKALESFMGTDKARAWVLRTKTALEKAAGRKGVN